MFCRWVWETRERRHWWRKQTQQSSQHFSNLGLSSLSEFLQCKSRKTTTTVALPGCKKYLRSLLIMDFQLSNNQLAPSFLLLVFNIQLKSISLLQGLVHESVKNFLLKYLVWSLLNWFKNSIKSMHLKSKIHWFLAPLPECKTQLFDLGFEFLFVSHQCMLKEDVVSRTPLRSFLLFFFLFCFFLKILLPFLFSIFARQKSKFETDTEYAEFRISWSKSSRSFSFSKRPTF